MLKIIKKLIYQNNLINRFLRINTNKRINYDMINTKKALNLYLIALDHPMKLTIILLSSYIYLKKTNKKLYRSPQVNINLKNEEIYLHNLKNGMGLRFKGYRGAIWCWDCYTNHTPVRGCPIPGSIYSRIELEEKRQMAIESYAQKQNM